MVSRYARQPPNFFPFFLAFLSFPGYQFKFAIIPTRRLHMARRVFLPAVVALLALTQGARADSAFLKAAVTGNPNVKSIDSLTFGPGGLLVLGDGKGAQVVVVDTGDVKAQKWEKTEIKDLA